MIVSLNLSDTYLSQDIQDSCYTYGDEYNICPELLMAIIEHESSGEQYASNKGCKGLMQISTKWHKDRMERLGVTDIYDIDGNIHVGADYLAELFNKYEDVAVVLAVYHGEKNAKTKTTMSNYTKSILERTEELERRHEYEEYTIGSE
jgi:soluble lytic murein transglycosylase-like protein